VSKGNKSAFQGLKERKREGIPVDRKDEVGNCKRTKHLRPKKYSVCCIEMIGFPVYKVFED
jgi:hypothetical protein